MILIREALPTVIVTYPYWWVSRMPFNMTRNMISNCMCVDCLMLQILLLKAIMIINTNGSTVTVFFMTSPTQFVVYGFILDSIVVVFIYTPPPLKRCLNCFSMIFTLGPTILFFKDNITIEKYFLIKYII